VHIDRLCLGVIGYILGILTYFHAVCFCYSNMVHGGAMYWSVCSSIFRQTVSFHVDKALQFQQVCVQPRPSAVNATLPAFAAERRRLCYWVISAAHRALSSKPAARRCFCRSMGRTDGRTLDRFIDCTAHVMRTASVTSGSYEVRRALTTSQSLQTHVY